MASFRKPFFFFKMLFFIVITGMAHADENLSSGVDCTEIEINFTDDPNLTKAERVAAMEIAFYESVNRFETCKLSSSSQSSSQSASQSVNSNTGSESGGGSDSNEAEGSIESAASPIIAGTEIEPIPPELDINESEAEITALASPGGGNGAIPEDIPDANNDDVVAAQIRLAAELEKDPEKKEKLWDEYRKYKGIIKNETNIQ